MENPLEAFLVSTGIVALAEIGDKTQIATIALAAQYHSSFSVVRGTTLGMMIANIPAVLLGERIAHRMPTKIVHHLAAAVFAVLGITTMLGAGRASAFSHAFQNSADIRSRD